MLHIILVRHAETDWNRLHRIQGTSDVPLNETGLRQAEKAGVYLKDEPFAAIYSSPMSRAKTTAQAIASHHDLEVISAPALQEIHYGAWEAMTLAEIPEKWPKEWAAFTADPVRNRPPGGEKITELLDRVDLFIADVRIKHNESSICLVGHTGSVRAILTSALSGTPDTWVRLSTWNASVSEVLYNDNGRAEVLRVNDHFFLDNVPCQGGRKTYS